MNVVLLSTYDLGHQPFGLASPAAWLREAGIMVAVNIAGVAQALLLASAGGAEPVRIPEALSGPHRSRRPRVSRRIRNNWRATVASSRNEVQRPQPPCCATWSAAARQRRSTSLET